MFYLHRPMGQIIEVSASQLKVIMDCFEKAAADENGTFTEEDQKLWNGLQELYYW